MQDLNCCTFTSITTFCRRDFTAPKTNLDFISQQISFLFIYIRIYKHRSTINTQSDSRSYARTMVTALIPTFCILGAIFLIFFSWLGRRAWKDYRSSRQSQETRANLEGREMPSYPADPQSHSEIQPPPVD